MSDNYTVESNVKKYALACSSQNRAGKFTRVSQDFLTDIEAEVDNLCRQIESKVREPLHKPPQGVEELRLITGHAMDKCRDRLEAALRKVIQNKIQGTPSVGCTL
jgi:hypothetical protein